MALEPAEKYHPNPINGIIKQFEVGGGSTVKISSSSQVYCLIVGGHTHYDNWSYIGLACISYDYSVVNKSTLIGTSNVGNYITIALDTDGKTIKVTNSGGGTGRYTIICFRGNIDDITVT